MTNNQWQLQEEALRDLYLIEGLDQIEIYYDIEQEKVIDPVTAVALSALMLVIAKMSEHLIEDIYESLKEKLQQVFHSRKHAAKLAMDITIAIKTEDAFVIVQDKVKSDAEIERLLGSAETICAELRQGFSVDAKRISTAELDNRLSKLPKIGMPPTKQ